MKRIAITGFPERGTTELTLALAAMTGFDVAARPPYPLLASGYRLDPESEKCQWPDSFVYCLAAFTERMMVEQQYTDRFVSDGSVLHELAWIKCRYPRCEPIYEQSMIRSLEQVAAKYTSAQYDAVFHIAATGAPSRPDHYIRQISAQYAIRYQPLDSGADKEAMLGQMVECLAVKPVLSAKHALAKSIDIVCNVLYKNDI